MRIGFIGLGGMGSAIAHNLIKAGLTLTATTAQQTLNCRRPFFLPGGSTRAFRFFVVARNFHLQDLTWIELRDSVAEGFSTAILPIGATEQSGPRDGSW